MQTMEAEKAQSVPWVRRAQDSGLTDDFYRTQKADDDEPDERDRSEYPSDFGRALFLEEEQREDDEQGQRDGELAEEGLNDSQTLGGAEHRDRGSYHAVAIQQCGSNEPDHGDRRLGMSIRFPVQTLEDQRDEREDSTLAVVVRSHDEYDVLDADDA